MGIISAGPLGREFVTVFMQNYQRGSSNSNLQVFVSAFNPYTTVTVSINDGTFKRVFTVGERLTMSTQVPSTVELQGIKKSSRVLIITSDKDISVLSKNYKPESADISILLPVQDLGKEYYILTPSYEGSKLFTVISGPEPASVDIYFTSAMTIDDVVIEPGEKFSFILQPYNAYQFTSENNLSGTRVVSQQPVAVLSGLTCNVKNIKCNHVYEQLYPVPMWGFNYIVPPIDSQTTPDVVYVLAFQATTITYQSGSVISTKTLIEGEVSELSLEVQTALSISATSGIQVLHYCTGGQDKSGIPYSPFLITVPPIRSFCSSFYVFGEEEFDNYGSIVAITSHYPKITFNKKLFKGLVWKSIPGTDYSWTSQKLAIGLSFQVVENPLSSFLMLSYGIAKKNSYGSEATCISRTTATSCSSVRCRVKEKCQMLNGKPACVPASQSYCWAQGDPHYRTFDGYFYDFQGTCTYTVAKTCGSDSGLTAFNIETSNENRGNSRVSYVSNVTVQVYSFTISLFRFEHGFVRVNDQRQGLPFILNNGKVRIYHSGSSVVVWTDFSLKVQYDWNAMLTVYLSSSYYENVCGLCGNYNGNPADDLAMPTGILASTLVNFGRSWKVEDSNRVCWDDCNGECMTCSRKAQQTYESQEACGVISKAKDGPFSACHSIIDPKVYVENCVYDLCMNDGSQHILCQSIKAYADACQRNTILIGEWRPFAECTIKCPENSEYKLCGNACPKTCNDNATPTKCPDPCVETCECTNGYVLDEGKCIPKFTCGCVFEGRHYLINEKFWGDEKCEKWCACSSTTRKVDCKSTQCKTSEMCGVVNGIRNCYSLTYGSCSVFGDSHYITFDGVTYDFQGTCLYQFVGVCKKSEDLVDFNVNVQINNKRGTVASYISAIQVKVFGFLIVISRQYKQQILLNGILTSLPYIFDKGNMSIYSHGFNAVIQTNFGLRVVFSWRSRVAVTIPSKYSGAVCGLCGNFNGDKANEFVTNNNQVAPNPTLFGKSWNVLYTEGCSEEDKGNCPRIDEFETRYRSSKEGCRILLDRGGPFQECQDTINPEDFFQDCVLDACFYNGLKEVICRVIASYAAACQEAGLTIHSWRSDTFCSPECSKNSHYEVCVSACSPMCPNLSPPPLCDSVCSEGCACKDGYVLSGGDCVPISQCGCNYMDKYFRLGEVFFPGGLCNQQCTCTSSGVVDCKAFSCGANEECKVVDGVQKCQPIDYAQCSAVGDSHYVSFDGLYFDFQSTCTYTLAKTVTNNAKLVPFAINVKNEKWSAGRVSVTAMVSIEVYGYKLVLQYNTPGKILVNGIVNNLPLSLEGEMIQVYQHGLSVDISTDIGVKVSYDLIYHVIVTVPGNYKDQLGGLCGNYNGERNDEFQKPDKTLASDAISFGSSWIVQIPNVNCDHGCGGSENPCPTCSNNKRAILETDNYCGFLKKGRGPLSACYGTISNDYYFRSCISELCANPGDINILCQNIQSYVAACQAAGATILPWRTETFCPLTCSPNSQYNICVDACSSFCAGLMDQTQCPASCAEGCQCNDKFFFDGHGCVPMDKCGCFENGKYYQLLETILSNDCTTVCTCSSSENLSCMETNCTIDEECQIVDGIVGCTNKDPCKSLKCRTKETCQIQDGKPVCVPDYTGTCWAWGDPHYHTFDGYIYDFQGTCTYILSKYTGNYPTLVPFTIEMTNENRGSQATSSVRTVSIYTYGYKLSIAKGEFGTVRINDIITNLPVMLLDGKISISISGLNAVVSTDFSLQVSYEYDGRVVVTLPSSYYGATGGLCGNFNQNSGDELIGIDNIPVTSIIDWAKSWKVNDRDPFCLDVCPGNCSTCNESEKNLYESNQFCGLISGTEDGPFRECHAKVNPDEFFNNCIHDVCTHGGAKQFLCQALSAYTDVCQRQGAKIYDWRTPSECSLSCPLNSHYELCGNACPASCFYQTAPARCTNYCVETCQCDDGFVLSADKCVPVGKCGCSYNGAYYRSSQQFWSDQKCSMLCKCDPNVGFVICARSRCKADEECKVLHGIRKCQPNSFSTCSSTGDRHYTTFDSMRFDFMGTCMYQLVGVTSSDSSLIPFVVIERKKSRGNRVISYTKVITLHVYGVIITLSMDFPYHILIDGVLTAIPFYYQTNKVAAYMSGSQCVIKTDFDVTVTYDWNSYVSVTVPSSYSNAAVGLCGNFNQNPSDDFTMKNGTVTTNVVELSNSWKVGRVSGCTSECTQNCPQCSESQKENYRTEKYCGIITNTMGPLSDCFSVIDPKPYFDDCVFDTCIYMGHPSSYCAAITLYVSFCQAAGGKVQEWRSSTFCPPSCPRNSHYELCGNGCPATCYALSAPVSCTFQCKEGCYCNNGFILSGQTCVSIVECGCIYQEKYYQQNKVFYPDDKCNRICTCRKNGIVKCEEVQCKDNTECSVVKGVRGCYGVGRGTCVTYGSSHYVSFDGLAFDFQGTCAYTLLKTMLSAFPMPVFSVTVENERSEQVTVTRMLVISVYGYSVTIDREITWKVKVDGVLHNLPLTLLDGGISVNQEGKNVILQTDFGLQVLYDTASFVSLSLPSSYFANLEGLCGNFNGLQQDDFRLPDNTVTDNVDIFGESWKVNISDANCYNGCGYQCPTCQKSKMKPYMGTTSCGIITNLDGPFKACHNVIKPENYFSACTSDLCISKGKTNILCTSLQAYTAACQAAGAAVLSWRKPTFCTLSCPTNSHYEICSMSCAKTCFDIAALTTCTDQCFEGCECNEGFLFDGDQCVPLDKCGCVFEGKYLMDGESSVSADCKLQCKCQATLVTCSELACGIKERCEIRNGVRNCYSIKSYCSVTFKKFVTFDGLSGKALPNGCYDLVSRCDNDTDAWFRVIVHIESCDTKMSSVSRIHIFLHRDMVTITKDMEVWVNGHYPFSAVKVSGLSVILEGDYIAVDIGEDLHMDFSVSGEIRVNADSGLTGAVCGICGDNNGERADDLLDPLGDKKSSILQMITSWTAHDFCNC
ncbi:c-binding -like [Pelobates cultripes]|uniref:C-binding -like n=1 Tax=Pelobates cultripes TaxID=61616 RepID=A0AAD1T793_PELCU|nr:c-binding -like [Pelobates cultripes]